MAEKRQTSHWLGVVARCTLLAGLIFQAGLLALRLFLDVTYPYPLDYGEGIALDRALALARGEPLYLPMDRPPYASWNFPPLYAWLCALGTRWAGGGFAFGRAVSAAAVLAAALCLYRLSRRHTADEGGSSRRWAPVAALLFLASETTASWGALMRVDPLAIALGLAGYTALVGGAPPVLAGALFGLALLCKQSVVAGLLAGCLALAVARRWRDLAATLATCALLVGAVLLWQHAATGGWVWRHLVTCNANPWRLDQARLVAGPVLAGHRVLLLLAGVGAAGALAAAARTPRERAAIHHPGLYYLAGAAVVSLLVGKIGSDVNYLLDLVAAACVLAAGAGARLEAVLERSLRPGLGSAVAAAILCLPASASFSYPPIETRLPMAAASGAAVRALARGAGPVISEDPGLVPISGKALVLQPFEFTQMAQAGRWDERPLVEALRQGRFSAILLRFDPWVDSHRAPDGTWGHGRFTDAMVQAMRSAYRTDERVYCWAILRPVADRRPETGAGPARAWHPGRRAHQ